MRQLFIQVPQSYEQKTVELIQKYEGLNTVHMNAEGEDGPGTLFITSVSNRRVGKLLAELDEISEARVTMHPHGSFAFKIATAGAPDQLTSVEARSPIEIFMGALQSIGSWKGLLGYAATAGVIVWIGLFTNSIVLLIAAMLIAPFAGPAMNLAVATARGDLRLLGRSLLRYFASIAVAIAVSAAISLLLGQNIITPTMDNVSQVSGVAVLLPLAVGAAGGLNLVQSERNSLVSGTATGVLVAASLAPPVGLIGMGLAMGEWDIVKAAAFLVFLQLVGINLTGSITFRLYGLSMQRTHYKRGRPWLFPVGLAATAILLAGLLVWQFSSSPELRHATVSQQAIGEVRPVIDDNPMVDLVEISARFTRTDIEGQDTLLIDLFVQRHEDATTSNEVLREQLSNAVQQRLLEQGYNVRPLVNVTVLEPPEPSAASG